MPVVHHFEYQAQSDAPHVRTGEIVHDFPLTPETAEYDETVEYISIFIRSHVTASVLDRYPRLRCIAIRSSGYDHVDLAACTGRGIAVCHIPSYGPHVIAAHAFMMILFFVRDMLGARKAVDRGKFCDEDMQCLDLAGRTLGVIGIGRIGREVVRLGSAYDMRVVGYDIREDATFAEESPKFSYVDLDTLFQKSDIIVLACSLTEYNHHMIDASRIRQMRGKILINVARGELIDEAALLSQHTNLRGVGLDVLTDESDEGLSRFTGKDNILITPHAAHRADTTIVTRWRETHANIDAFSRGESRNQVV